MASLYDVRQARSSGPYCPKQDTEKIRDLSERLSLRLRLRERVLRWHLTLTSISASFSEGCECLQSATDLGAFLGSLHMHWSYNVLSCECLLYGVE